MTPEIGQADVFISHAHEDKEVARPLAEALRQRGLTVWYDEYVLRLGDSLREVIDRGLATARFGVVILSPSFFAKEWPQRELNAMLARETAKRTKVLLPVWHNLTLDEIVAHSPILAERMSVSTAKRLPFVVEQILQVLESEKARDAASASPPSSPRTDLEPPRSLPGSAGVPAGGRVKKKPARTPALPGKNPLRNRVIAAAILASLLLVTTLLLWRPWRSSGVPGPLVGQDKPSPPRAQPMQKPSVGSNPVPGEERVQQKDGSVLVYVPGGEYVLGADDITDDEKPVHRVVLSPFWIGEYEVTNEQYGRFLTAVPGNARPQYWNDDSFNQPRQPVVGVSWDEARAYCSWAGLALPSEAQWEAAARGKDRRRYPWGNKTPTAGRANFGNKGRTTAVGSFPRGAGPFGTLDQAGNVWEWCEDVWDAKAYHAREAAKDPVNNRGDTTVRCLRGGSWVNDAGDLAAACRSGGRASYRFQVIGFRCLLLAGPEL